MKSQMLSIVSITAVVLTTAVAVSMCGLSVVGDFPALDPSLKFYEDCINKYISRCRIKAALFKNLKFKNVQKMVSLAQQKAVFLSENKNQLTHEMIAENIGKKHYKVNLYLNKRFNESNLKDDIAPSHSLATRGR